MLLHLGLYYIKDKMLLLMRTLLHLGWFITFRPSIVFLAHVVGELPCGSQPTAPTCVVWSWRLIDGFVLISVSRGFEMLVYPVHYSNSFATLVDHNRCETAVCVSPCLRVMCRAHVCRAFTSLNAFSSP